MRWRNDDVIRHTHQSNARTMLPHGCVDFWTWDKHAKSHEVQLFGERDTTAHFHPNWSNGTAGVRGAHPLNCGRHYWEVKISQRVFGTSMMFGIGTANARLHVDSFVNMIGEDTFSWGLSHKGLLWHNGKWTQYTKPFKENTSTTIGLLYDGFNGTLTYYKDGESMGTAFRGITDITTDELYPIVCSTAAKTEMTLGARRRSFLDLQDRCRAVVATSLKADNDIDNLPLPNRLKHYISDVFSY